MSEYAKGVRKVALTVHQVRSDDGSQFLNLDAGYGYLAAWFHAHERWRGTSAALLRFGDGGIYVLVLYDPDDGIPERYKDYEIVWQINGKRDGDAT